jgi:hypothetical protein
MLEARRRVLLQRCEQQRLALAYRLERLTPGTQLSSLANHAKALSLSRFAPTVLFWGATILTTVMLLRPGKVLGKMAWLTSAMALASRATHLVRLFAQMRDLGGLFRQGASHHR